MEAIQRLQGLDFLFAIVWATVVAWGVRSGVVRQLTTAVAVYIGVIAAGQLYRPLGQALTLFGFGPGATQPMQWFAYVLLFLLVPIVFVVGAWRLYPHTALVERPWLDHVLGGLVAAVWGLVFLIGLVVIIQYYSLVPIPGQEQSQLDLATQLQRSQLLPVLQIGFSPLWSLVAPWYPDPVRNTFAR